MPEIKHNFTGGKMNKDLDERIVPNGQYRDAMNVQVSTSDGSDVGVIQNILGNELGCSYTEGSINPILPDSTTIASISDEKHDTLYWFVSGPNFTKYDVREKIKEGGEFRPNPKYNKDLIMRKTLKGCEPVLADISSVLTSVDSGMRIQYSSPGNYPLTIPSDIPIITTTQQIGTIWTEIEGVHCGCGGNHYNPTGRLLNGGVSGLAIGDAVSGTNIPLGATVTGIADANTNQLKITLSDVPVIPGWKQGTSGDEIWPFITQITFTREVASIDDIPKWFGVNIPEVAAGMSVVAVGANGFSSAAKVVSVDELASIQAPLGSSQFQTPNKTAYLHSLRTPGSGNLVMNSPSDYNKVEVGDQFTIEFLGSDGWQGIGSERNELYTVQSKDPGTKMINIGDYTEASWANHQPNGPGAIRILTTPPLIYSPDTNDAGDTVTTIILDRDLHLNNTIKDGDPSAPKGLKPVLLWNGPYEYLYFYKDRVLNFDKDKLITGVNIIDDMLFWTDNNTEPKKVNISRSIAGTDISGNKHTKLVNDSLNIGRNYAQGIDIPLLESHITVIKKSPQTQLTLGLNAGRDAQKNYSGKFKTTEDLSLHAFNEGDVILFGSSSIGSFLINTTIEDNTNFSLFGESEELWRNGTSVVLKEFNDGDAPNAPIGNTYRIKGTVSTDDNSNFTSKKGIIKFAVKILSIDGDIPRATGDEHLYWAIDYFKEEIDFFENKFARFSYRYKYEDGEYSTFAPFTQVAFIPGEFDYHPTKGYNLGMTNKLTSISLSNFVTKDMPLDVVEIDLLYKEDVSPNIYIVDTIKPNDYPHPVSDANTWRKNLYTITSGTIRGALPSNQLLRPWDNVPRKALAQEITGNRIVYANYLQNYNLITTNGKDFYPDFKHAIIPSEPNFDKKSIKSLREYQLGVVFTDKYGRETPVISNSTGTFKLDKAAATQENRLQVGFNGNLGSVPSDFEYYKFFIKETSGEYYNMAMDRFYDAEDGNWWLAFPSSDRNKVDIDTFLVLKKGPDSPLAILEQARYKILAIENEAPDFIKTKTLNIASGSIAGDGVDEDEVLFPLNDLVNCPVEGVNNFTFNYNPFAFTAAKNMHTISDDLYIEFSLGGQATSNRYRISSITRDLPHQEPEDESQFHVTIDGFLGNDVNFILDDPANPKSIVQATTITVYKRVVENSPKFDGKFFVKIYADPTFNNKMNVNSRKSYESFVPKQAGRKMYFMRNSFPTDHKSFFDGSSADTSAYPESTDGDWWSSGIVSDGQGGTVIKGIGAGPNQVTGIANGCDGCLGLGTLPWHESTPDVSYYNTQDLNQQDANLNSHTGYGSKTQSTWFDNHGYFKSFFGPYTAARPEDIVNTTTNELDEIEGCCDPDAENNYSFRNGELQPNNKDNGSICLYTSEFLQELNDAAEIMLFDEHEDFDGFYGMAQAHEQWQSTAHNNGYNYNLFNTTTPYNGSAINSDTNIPYQTNKDYIWGEWVDGVRVSGSSMYESAQLVELAKHINYNFEEIPGPGLGSGPTTPQEDLENNFVTFVDAGPYVESQSSGSNAVGFSYNYAAWEATSLRHKGSFDGEKPMNHGVSNAYNRKGVINKSNERAEFNLGWGGIDSIADRSKWNNSNGWLWYETHETNWWALGQNVGGPGAVDRDKYHFIREFLQGFEPGAQFRWKEDPTEQVYTIIEHNGPLADRNLVNYSAGEIDGERNQHALTRSGDPDNYGQSNWPKASTYLKPYNFRRSKSFDVYPNVTWNPSPANEISEAIPNGAYINKYLPHPTAANFIDSSTPVDLVASQAFSNTTYAFGITKEAFNNSWDSQVANGLAPITRGMILTHVEGVELTPPLLVKDITFSSQVAQVYIELEGYSEILGLTVPQVLGTGLGGLEVDSALVFQHPTMNGLSPASAKHISSLYPSNTNGIGAVGYTLEFVQGIEREAVLPEDPSVWETEPKPSVDLDIYYEISGTNPIKLNKHTIKTILPVGSTLSSEETIAGIGASDADGSIIPITIVGNDSALGNVIYLSRELYVGNNGNNNPIKNGSIFNVTRPDGTSVSVSVNGWTAMETPNQYKSFTFRLDSFLYKSQYVLDWHNCYSFKNGVESNRIRDNFNLPYISNGVRASTTLEGQYKEERRKSGLIYSGIYNSNSGVNNLNQFIQAEKITKDVNPIYGSIQKLHSRSTADGDLIALCEDRVLRILANKDAVYNADGNPQLIATENVLGQTVPFSGEFGISTNPESFASESYRVYFADKIRGTILRLSKDGLTPISDYGMKDWFKDNLKLSNKIIGSYDDKKDEYNVTLLSYPPFGSIVKNSKVNAFPIEDQNGNPIIIKVISWNSNVLELNSPINDLYLGQFYNGTLTFYEPDGVTEIATAKMGRLYNPTETQGVNFSNFITFFGLSTSKTVSFREDVKGWVSFKSFFPENAASMANDYYTFIGGDLFKHHIEKSVDRNTFYNSFFPSSVNVILNDAPGVVKSFHTLNYEGSQSKVNAEFRDDQYFNIYGEDGWYAESFETDKEKGSLKQFVEKEGKWFGYLKGKSVTVDDTNHVEWDNDSSFDQASFAIQGIGRTNSIELLPCVGIQGCTDPSYEDYNPDAVCNDGTCLTIISYPTGCTAELAENFDSEAVIDDGSCITYNCFASSTRGGTCTDPGTGSGMYYSVLDCEEVCSGFSGQPSWDCSYAAGTWVANGPLAGQYIAPWNCTDLGMGTGQYSSLSACVEACRIPPTYDCVGIGSIGDVTNGCIEITDGTGYYSTLNTCNDNCTNPGCTNPDAPNYDPLAVGDDSSCCADTWWQTQTPTASITPYSASLMEIALTWQFTTTSSTAGLGGMSVKIINQTTGVEWSLSDFGGSGTTYSIFVYNNADYLIFVGAECEDSITGLPYYIYGPGQIVPGATTIQYNCVPVGPIGNLTNTCVQTAPGVMGTYATLAACTDITTGCPSQPLPATGTGTVSNPGELGVIGEIGVTYGCTNPEATNYDPLATIDDGSCINIIRYPTGCTNPQAANYDPSAVLDDGSCIFKS